MGWLHERGNSQRDRLSRMHRLHAHRRGVHSRETPIVNGHEFAGMEGAATHGWCTRGRNMPRERLREYTHNGWQDTVA